MRFATTFSLSMSAFLGLVIAQTTPTASDPIVTGILGNASVVENNPPGVVYTATLPDKEFFNPSDPRGNIKGSISAVAGSNGIGVSFSVDFQNFPTSGGPFLYHIHAAPVPADGNCTGTLAHLDPYIRGETPACDPKLPQTCQVGDLSGKHGSINTTTVGDHYTANYVDSYPATVPGIGAFFGNRSITIHFANKTRITCANFTMKGSPTNSSVTPTMTPIQYTGIGAGERNAVSMLSLMAVAGGVFFFM